MLNAETKAALVNAAHLLSGQQEVLVDVGSQKSCIAVTFHQLKNVLLQEKQNTKPKEENSEWMHI